MAIDFKSGIVLAGILGSLFFIACVISSVKAVKDRKRIKKRIAAREREKNAKGISTISGGGTDGETKGVTGSPPATNGIEEPPGFSGVTCVPTQNASRNGSSAMALLHPPTYQECLGVDNLTFTTCSSEKIASAGENQTQSKEKGINTVDDFNLKHPKPHPKTKRTVSRDSAERQQKRLTHLPPECLAVQKTLRRHSYEIAVGDYSWLPMETPAFASTKTINNTYNYGDRTVGFENRAFDVDDGKKT